MRKQLWETGRNRKQKQSRNLLEEAGESLGAIAVGLPVPPRSPHRVLYNAPEAGQRGAGDTVLSPAGPTGTQQRAQAAPLCYGPRTHPQHPAAAGGALAQAPCGARPNPELGREAAAGGGRMGR